MKCDADGSVDEKGAENEVRPEQCLFEEPSPPLNNFAYHLPATPGFLGPAGLDGAEHLVGNLIQGAVHHDLFPEFRVGTAIANINDLRAGKDWRFKAVYFGEGGYRFCLNEIQGF